MLVTICVFRVVNRRLGLLKGNVCLSVYFLLTKLTIRYRTTKPFFFVMIVTKDNPMYDVPGLL